MTDPYELVLDRLAEHGCGPKERGGTIYSRCPAHDDTNPSLTVDRGETRDVVIHCHTGCTADAVMEALSLTWADFKTNGATSNGIGEIVATYDYHNAQSVLLFQAVRFHPKAFRQRRPDGTGGWTWKLGDTPRVLYHLPEVLAEVARGGEIWIAEGEKDVDALRAAGVVATCNPMGAGKFTLDHAHTLRGITRAIIVADRDQTGRDHALSVAQNLSFAGVTTVHIVQGKDGCKDAADHLAAGHGIDDFEIVDPAVDWATPAPEPPPDRPLTPLERLRASLLTMAQLRALPPPRWRIDGIFYDGSVVLLWSPPGSFKSFLAADMALSVAYGVRWHDHKVWHGPVIYFAGEGKAMFQQRIDAWLHTHGRQDSEAFTIGPLMPNLFNPEWRAATLELAIERQPALVVIDTVARAMVGGEENSAKDMGVLVDTAGQTAQETGAVVLLVHHSTKTGDNYRGSSALQGAVDTELEAQRDGMNVTIHCRKQKDALEFEPVKLHLETCENSLIVVANHLQTGVEVDASHQAILDVLTSTGTSTYGQIEKRSGLPASTFLRKLNDLVNRGVVAKTPAGKYDLAD